VSTGSRGGQRAALPDPAWQPPERLITEGGTVAVRFVEETGGRSRVFDFAGMQVEPGMRRWLAEVFARQAGARSPVKRLTTAKARYHLIGQFAASLAEADPVPAGPAELTAAHLDAFRDRYTGQRTQHDQVKGLRTLLRHEPQLPARARAALFGPRLPPKPPGEPFAAYLDAEWRQIMTALRHDVRSARDRVRSGRDLLARYRAGALPAGSEQGQLAALLDVFDRTGDVSRTACGDPVRAVYRAGGLRAVARMLCLDRVEVTAFCLLLTALTGENFGTVAVWPAVACRPGGTERGNPGVVLVEAVKPRRGAEREHMVTAVEDVPTALAAVLDEPGEEPGWLGSPLGVYRLLVELAEPARRHGGHTAAAASFTPAVSRLGRRWGAGLGTSDVIFWARRRGFPGARDAGAGTGPAIHVGRIRQTAIEHRRHPVAHSRATMNDLYLARSRTVQAESRTVVAAALREQVGKARAQHAVPVFTAGFVARARQDPDAAAAEAGLAPGVLTEVITGMRDAAVAACTDHLAGPHAAAGQACPASFLICLECPNARALPHHLPVQLAVHDRIAALGAHLDPAVWRARYQLAAGALGEIIGHYTPAEQARARGGVTSRQEHLADELLAGRMDLR
jgi:hypothetical protein